MAKSKDSSDCFTYSHKIKNSKKLNLFNPKFYKDGVGYTFDTKYSFLVLKGRDTVNIIDYDGGYQISLTEKKKQKKMLLTGEGKEFFSGLINHY